jgi:hypothetical protein
MASDETRATVTSARRPGATSTISESPEVLTPTVQPK